MKGQMYVDMQIVKDNPVIFNPLYDEWDKIKSVKCSCVECDRCIKSRKMVKKLQSELAKIRENILFKGIGG